MPVEQPQPDAQQPAPAAPTDSQKWEDKQLGEKKAKLD